MITKDHAYYTSDNTEITKINCAIKLSETRRGTPSPLFSHLYEILGFPGGSDSKASACNAGDPGLIPGLGRSPGEGNSNLLQHSCLKIPWTDEPDRLESMGSQRVRHDWATSLSLYEITRLNGNCHISAPSKQETQRTMTSFLFGSCESRELPFCSKYSIRKQPPWREKPPGATENSEINSGFLTRRQSSSRCLRRRVKSINFKLCYLKVHVATSGVTIHQIRNSIYNRRWGKLKQKNLRIQTKATKRANNRSWIR